MKMIFRPVNTVHRGIRKKKEDKEKIFLLLAFKTKYPSSRQNARALNQRQEDRQLVLDCKKGKFTKSRFLAILSDYSVF